MPSGPNPSIIPLSKTTDKKFPIFLADLTENLTPKQLEAIDSVIADYGFNNFEGYYTPKNN